jgi:hypothetical protein
MRPLQALVLLVDANLIRASRKHSYAAQTSVVEKAPRYQRVHRCHFACDLRKSWRCSSTVGTRSALMKSNVLSPRPRARSVAGKPLARRARTFSIENRPFPRRCGAPACGSKRVTVTANGFHSGCAAGPPKRPPSRRFFGTSARCARRFSQEKVANGSFQV